MREKLRRLMVRARRSRSERRAGHGLISLHALVFPAWEGWWCSSQSRGCWRRRFRFFVFFFYDVFSHFGFFCLVYLYRILFLKLFYFLFVSFARRKPPRDVEQQSASCLRWKSKEALHKLASRETLRLRPFTFQKEGMTRLSASLSHG